jgi:DNA-binding GntR family transcriptional regulator
MARDGPCLAWATVDPRLYMRIRGVLSRRIADGTLPSGTRLNIGTIADEFDVSRDTVQHAIGLLAGDGLIERYEGLGWFVTERKD